MKENISPARTKERIQDKEDGKLTFSESFRDAQKQENLDKLRKKERLRKMDKIAEEYNREENLKKIREEEKKNIEKINNLRSEILKTAAASIGVSSLGFQAEAKTAESDLNSKNEQEIFMNIPSTEERFNQEVNKEENYILETDEDINKIREIAEKEPRSFLEYFPNYKDVPGVNELIPNAAEKKPWYFLRYFPNYKDVPGIKKITEKFFINNPDIVDFDPSILDNLKSEDKSIQVLKNLKNRESAILLHDMVNNNMTEEEAMAIIKDPAKLIEKLIEIKSVPDHLGSGSIERYLTDICLRTIRTVNQLHNRPSQERFKSIEPLNSKSLYLAMVYGEDEIFTSSFNGCFDRLVPKMNNEKINGKQLLDQVHNQKVEVFIKECTWFNRLNEFLSKMSKEEADLLLRNIVKNLEISNDKLDQSITVAEIFGGINDPKTIEILQNQVKIQYESAKDKDNKIIYGLLSGMLKDKVKTDKEWFTNMSQEYEMQQVTNIESKDLFDEKGICHQRFNFFEDGDGDGISSFNNFVSKYENDPNYKINRTNKSFIVITGKLGTRTIEIYANDPRGEDRGDKDLEDMDKYINEKGIKVKLGGSRGHSFGFNINGLQGSKIIMVGSCGGFNNISKILEDSPDAHVISTKGTGTMAINDIIIKDLNNKILKGENIDWANFWRQEETKLQSNEKFKDYIPPNLNQGMMFLRAYNDLTSK